jgi:hypothetical protein
MARSRRLTLELLEDRTAPAVFGVPWPDPTHLTLSFAPDGTQIGGQTSSLFASLDAHEPTAAWQADVARAVQTWAVNTKLSVGIVPDAGQPFGASVSGENHSHSGLIRIGAAPLSAGVLAISAPHDPFLAGNWSGDIILNSTVNFTRAQSNLYGVLLHELGHVFGLSDSTNPNSVLYRNKTWVTNYLATSDVAAIQALYGPPPTSPAGHHTRPTASPIRFPSDDGVVYTGTTPLLAFGDLAANKQSDFFSVQTASFTGPMTFRLQTAGLSLLRPQLIVYDASGNMLGQAQSTSVVGDTVSMHLDSVPANTTYYIRVSSATGGLFAVGRYGLAVTFDATLTTTPAQIASMLSSSHSGDPSDDVTLGSVVALQTTAGYAPGEHYEVSGGLTSAIAYSLQAPAGPSGADLTLTVAVRVWGEGGRLPQLQVLDATQQPVATKMLVNGAGFDTIQVSGLAPGQTYYLSLTPPTTTKGEDGAFSLVADFKQTSSLLPLIAAGTSTAGSSSTYSLTVAPDQLFDYTLSVAGTGAPVGSTVQMTITDSGGHVLATQVALSGQAMTGAPVLLTPGVYTIHISLVTPGGAPGALSFELFGTSITDPIGPAITDPTLSPFYNNSGGLIFNGKLPVLPYQLVSLVL